MKIANYFIIGQIFGLLERIQLIHEVDFSQFDIDNEKDVRIITEEFIKPTVEQSTAEAQDTIHTTILYYSTFKNAPIQIMKDHCHDLALADSESWEIFFYRVGATLFGSEFELDFDAHSVTERSSEQESEVIFRRRG